MEKELTLSEIIYPELKTTYRLDYGSPNFHIWRSKLDFVFKDNNVEYVLSEPIPDERTDAVAHQKFLDDDFTARHIIIDCIKESVYFSYSHHQTAKSLLDALTSFFTKHSMLNRMLLLRRYVNHKMSDDTPVNEHVLKMSALAMELQLEGVKVPDKLQAVFLMNSLPDSWEDVMPDMIMRIDNDEKGLTLETVSNAVRETGALKELLKARDKARSISGSSSKTYTFRGKCYGCGETGHRQTDCPYEDDVL